MVVEAAQTWAERAQAELGAARRFRELAERLTAVGVQTQLIALVGRAVQDEEEHAFLCARMARELGHETGFEKPAGVSAAGPPSWSHRASTRERVLLDVVAMCCVTESFNTSLLHTLYTHAEEGPVRSLLHRILKDETRHAQIGWAFLGSECARSGCEYVADYLGEMLDTAVRDVVFVPVPSRDAAPSLRLGVLPLSQRLEHLCTTLDEIIIPGFTHFGIDPSAMTAWRDRKLRRHPAPGTT
jgi:hypothetical protein